MAPSVYLRYVSDGHPSVRLPVIANFTEWQMGSGSLQVRIRGERENQTAAEYGNMACASP